MPSRDVYKRQLELHGVTQRQRVITNTQNDIAKDAVASPSYKSVIVNGLEMALVIHSTKKPNEKTFNTLPGGLVNIGDSIVWNKMHWLITEIDFDDEITRGGTIIQCNREIRWQNPVTLELISRWCFAERPYANGIKDGNIISVPDRQFRIKLPYDKETMLVDIGRRFMLETIDDIPRTYKLLMPDLVTSRFTDSEGGFIVWNLEFDSKASEPNDNLELGVCDYIPPGPTPPPVDPDPTLLKCEVTGSSVIKIGGSARSYKGIFYLADGVTIDETVQAIWSIDIDHALADKIISTPNGNSIDIACVDDLSMDGVSFKLQLSDIGGAYQPCELAVKVVIPI